MTIGASVIHKNEERKKFVEKFTVEKIDSCSKCSLKYHCCGGCATIKLLSGNGDMFRKADYCEDFQKYAFTIILSKLFDIQMKYIETLPEEYTKSNASIEQDVFESTVVEKILSIEE